MRMQGTLDLMLQRLPLSGDRTNKRRVTFIQNNYFHDAFFLKALGKSRLSRVKGRKQALIQSDLSFEVLNGACLGYCDGAKGEPKYRVSAIFVGGNDSWH